MLWTKRAHQCKIFQTFGCSNESSSNSSCHEELCKIWGFFVSKMTRTWWILIRALKRLKYLHFDWPLLCKVYNVWLRKAQRRCVSWHSRVMQNLKKNWLVVWKMTWGIWQIFIRTLESNKIGTFMGSFLSKVEMS